MSAFIRNLEVGTCVRFSDNSVGMILAVFRVTDDAFHRKRFKAEILNVRGHTHLMHGDYVVKIISIQRFDNLSDAYREEFRYYDFGELK